MAVDFYDEKNPFTFRMVGATQMIDRDGSIIARRFFNEGEGMIISDFSFDRKLRAPADIDFNKYWIEELPDSYVYAWKNDNLTGRAYYKKTAKPYYDSHYKK